MVVVLVLVLHVLLREVTALAIKAGLVSLNPPLPPSGPKGGSGGKMTSSTPKYDNQPTCYNCHAKGHFRSQCPKLVTVGPSKTPQKPVALLVWPDQGREERLLASKAHEGKKAFDGPVLDCEEGAQAVSPVSPPVVGPKSGSFFLTTVLLFR